MKIAIIGAGTAGSAAALFLGRAGHQVTVFEAVPKPGPVGAGILLQPTGQAVLARLGLLEPVLKRGAKVQRLQAETTGGRRILDLQYEDLEPGIFGLGIHRGVLFETLFTAACKEVQVHCGIHIRDLAPEGQQKWLIASDESRYGPFEMVVVADGAGSDLRDDTDLRSQVSFYSWGALWFVGDHPPLEATLFQRVEGTTKMLGMLPTGKGPSGEIPHVSLFWSIRGDQVEGWRKDFGGWKRLVERMEPRAAPILAQVQAPEQMLYARYRDVRMRRWATRDVVYIGDAAHAMSPQLGQGANLALVDAAVLAECMAGVGLSAYTSRRRSNLRFYQLATRWLTPWFQSDYRLLGPIRDFCMPLATKIPWVRTQMLASMAGFKTGLLTVGRVPQLIGDGGN